MNRSNTRMPVSFLVMSLLVTSGCVSSSKYKKLEADKNQQLTDCNTKMTALAQEKDSLAQQKDELAKANQKNEAAYDSIVHQLADEVQKGDLKITQYKNMLNVDIADQIFFASGSATLKQGGKDVLKKLAKALASYPEKIIWVVGHTDDVPLAKAIQSTYPTNWELSVIRATNVVRFLQDSGVMPGVLIASGRSEFAPVGDNKTPEGRQKNRRIEIKLLDKSLLESLQQAPKQHQANGR
jgi:chemotaxis protein MotB